MSTPFSDARLAKLQEEFPETPGNIVLKADVLRQGVRYTEELGEAVKWAIASERFLSREDVPERESSGNAVRVPNQLILEDDTRINTELDRKSPYTVRKEGEKRYVLCREDAPIAEVSFTPRPKFSQTLSDGSRISRSLGQRAEGCIAVLHTMFCEYAKNRDQCGFCIFGNSMAGLTLADMPPGRSPVLKKSAEACALAVKEIDIYHVVVSGGAFLNTSLEAKSYAKTITAIRKAVGPEARITAVCQALDEEGWLLLKDAGASRVQPNLEVWDDKLWPEVIPGKDKAIGKATWIERLKTAVGIFGVGEVATNFVAGAEMGDHGFRDFGKAIDSHMEGYAFLLDKDIVPVFGFLTKAKGTKYENAELPPTEYYLKLGWGRTKLMMESGMFDQFTDGIDSDFSCYKCVTHKTCQDYPRLLKEAEAASTA